MSKQIVKIVQVPENIGSYFEYEATASPNLIGWGSTPSKALEDLAWSMKRREEKIRSRA